MTGRRQQYLLPKKPKQDSDQKVQAMGWSRKYFACPFVFKQGSQGYYCLLCDCVIYGYTAFNNHIHGKRHIASVEQYGSDISSLKDDYYYCRRCDCVVPYYTNVFSHITGKRHQSLLYLDSQAIDWSSCDYFVCPFVSREGAEKYYCLICGCYMFGHTAFQSHIHGKLHAIAVETFGRHISPLGDDYYFCSQCDCAIPHYKNVYDHIVGQRHQNSLYGVDDQNNQISTGEERESKELKVDQRAASTEVEEFPKLDNFSGDSYKPVLGNQNLVFNVNQQDNPRLCEDFSAREMFARKLQQSDENSNQNTLYEFVAIKNKMDLERDNVLSETEKPIQLGKALSRSYTILPRPVDKESKDIDRKASCWKKISDKAESPMRLNLDSWQLSSCKNFLQNGTAKYEVKNSTCKNLGDNLAISTQRDSSSDAMLSDSDTTQIQWNAQISSNWQVPLKLIEQLKLVKSAKDDSSAVQNPPKVSTSSETELCANATSLSNEKSSRPKVDMNGNNETSNDTPKNYQPQNRDIVELILTSKINDFMDADLLIHGVDLNMNDLSSNSAISSLSDENCIDEDSSIQHSPSSPSQRVSKKSPHAFDYFEDIYKMNEKMRALQLGMQLFLIIDSRKIYCLVCHKLVEADETNYVQHLAEVEHCELLEEQKKDHTFFEMIPIGFSDLYLACEYMLEKSQDIVQCFICDEGICNASHALLNHIEKGTHVQRREEMHEKAAQSFERVKSQMQCDWYKIYRYLCVPCSANFDCEINFLEHLKTTQHAKVAKKPENCEREMIYDFCTSCALLWFGYRNTYGKHCESSGHKWFLLQAPHESSELCEPAKLLLTVPEVYINTAIEYLEETSVDDEKNTETLIDDLENAVKSVFPRAKAHACNLRPNDLATPSRNVDVFLDCGNVCDRKILSHQILSFIRIVHKRLSDDPLSWKTEELEVCFRSHAIRAHHRGTGLCCRISFDNGLAIESFKLLKYLMKIVPVFWKLLLFLEQWLALCNLSGSEGITSYALHWLVVFFLQQKSMLTSVATLIAIKKKSHTIAGWESICKNYVDAKSANAVSIKELLATFFSFYANFDYRYDVVCPSVGEAVKKQEFAEPFRIDAAMCVQDPFNLQENLTKGVSKAHLSRLRNCCSKSLLLLRES